MSHTHKQPILLVPRSLLETPRVSEGELETVSECSTLLDLYGERHRRYRTAGAPSLKGALRRRSTRVRTRGRRLTIHPTLPRQEQERMVAPASSHPGTVAELTTLVQGFLSVLPCELQAEYVLHLRRFAGEKAGQLLRHRLETAR